jgi:PatG C-terminal
MEQPKGDAPLAERALPAGTEPPAAGPTDPAGPAPASTYVFALGQVEPRFPSLGVEKEFAQAIGRAGAAGLTDRQATRTALAERANRYLARQLCWVFTVEGLETYLLVPRDPGDLDLLVEAVRDAPDPADLDLVIGVRGPLAPPDVCNGLVVPVVVFDQLYSFDRPTLLGAIPRPESVPARQEEQFRAGAAELFDLMLQLADNSGATDEHRAVNYLAVRYPAIYARAAECRGRNAGLTDVEVRPSRLSGVRRIVDVVFTFTHRETGVPERYFARVDVTEEFPFLASPLQPFYERST